MLSGNIISRDIFRLPTSLSAPAEMLDFSLKASFVVKMRLLFLIFSTYYIYIVPLILYRKFLLIYVKTYCLWKIEIVFVRHNNIESI